MLFNAIFYFLAVLNIICIIWGAFIMGRIIGRTERTASEPPKAQRKPKESPTPPEVDRYNTIMSNIDNYGTNKPQKDVE